jgi:cardiolipin synthase
MLVQRKKPSTMIAWTVIIIFLPYIGIFIYIVFNGRKIIKKKLPKKLITFSKIDNLVTSDLEKLLIKSNIANSTSSNYFHLYKNSIVTYEKITKSLLEAKSTIYISTYIFADDYITHQLLDILTKKAKEGVSVKLLIDSFGSISLEIFPKILKPLKDAGGECHFFMSILRHPIKNRLNLRNHRKMIIVDEKVVISGGINISKEYLSVDQKSVWCDLSFLIEGSACTYYSQIFRQDFEFETGKKLRVVDTKNEKGSSVIQVVPSGPDVDNDALYESILYSIYMAKSMVWIVTPYFVPDGSLMDALIIAKHRGVDVKIVLPNISDHYLVDVSRAGYLRDLQKEDIDILFFKPKMLHAKVMVVDEIVAMVGSSNFDSRSLFYNFEVMSFLYSKDDIESIKSWVKNLFDKCSIGLKPAGKGRLIVENFFKMLSPAL